MPTAPTAHTPMPPAPSTSDPVNFDSLADPFVAAMNPLGVEVEANASAAYANAGEAASSATAAAGSATAAAESATAAAGQVTLAAAQVALATTQVGLATTQANNAAGSASSAAATLVQVQNVASGVSFSTTSTTSNSIALGSKTWTVDANESFVQGMPLAAVVHGDPTRFMVGICTSYSGTTLVVAISQISAATGTFASWDISVGGVPGAPGAGVPNGGAAGRVLRKKTTTDYDTEWAQQFIKKRTTVTGAYTLSETDRGNLIALSSTSAFTAAFAALSAIEDGWWVLLESANTGFVTLDPNGSETIDGLSSFVMMPKELRLVQKDNGAITSTPLRPFYHVYTAGGTFPPLAPGYAGAKGRAWPSGMGGGANNGSSSAQSGAAGGACYEFFFPRSALSSAQTVTIGASVAGTSGANPVPGNDTLFGSLLTAKAPSLSGGVVVAWYDRGSVSTGSGTGVLSSLSMAGGLGVGSVSGNTYWGGAACNGTSVMAGQGGLYVPGVNGTAGTAPGGGGGNCDTGNTGGASGRGELRIEGVLG